MTVEEMDDYLPGLSEVKFEKEVVDNGAVSDKI